jgi:myo-inositol-1(or 4)-monophosphatase
VGSLVHSDASIGVEYGSSRKGPALDGKMDTFRKLAADPSEGGLMAHSLRSVGSAAINIALVATGGLDM